ncbi:HAD family hydrolase [Rhodalgimonas zhirmunskyi]|uniref:Sulfotransferase n=1 Tax=Rhodalgimonas zhirmunskyi TaxID=2964767 RepID=A0AAJ1UDW9_9RHOB|nr:HAD family hydrolase [Rhodoalgimonas zhirmunskyi]MDQ2094227.1 sulfotransferase [Rhodoalgimonas zhirmunskyi]
MRIAMWSGPRNLSTAMMYAFGARADCAVVDEPFYAAYLAQTGLAHPMRAEIMAAQSQDAEAVAQSLTGPIPAQKPHFYQKHMCQHMLPGIPRDWMARVTNVFLIRHPARVIASFGAKYENPTLADIGFTQQAELYDHARALGQTPIVIDSADIRRAPEMMLRKLCDAIGLAFDPAMLSWPKGGHPDDGVWAPHWYGAVHASTGFAPAEGPLPDLSEEHRALAVAALPIYEALAKVKL